MDVAASRPVRGLKAASEDMSNKSDHEADVFLDVISDSAAVSEPEFISDSESEVDLREETNGPTLEMEAKFGRIDSPIDVAAMSRIRPLSSLESNPEEEERVKAPSKVNTARRGRGRLVNAGTAKGQEKSDMRYNAFMSEADLERPVAGSREESVTSLDRDDGDPNPSMWKKWATPTADIGETGRKSPKKRSGKESRELVCKNLEEIRKVVKKSKNMNGRCQRGLWHVILDGL